MDLQQEAIEERLPRSGKLPMSPRDLLLHVTPLIRYHRPSAHRSVIPGAA
jgi:hypothetical protein